MFICYTVLLSYIIFSSVDKKLNTSLLILYLAIIVVDYSKKDWIIN